MNCGICKWYEPYQGVCSFGDSPHCSDFVDANDVCDCWEKKPMTNGDRIRAMSDEELAEFLNKCQSCDDVFPVELWKNWLIWPAEVE